MKFQPITIDQCPFCGATEGEDHDPNCEVAKVPALTLRIRYSTPADVRIAVSSLKSDVRFWKESAAYLTLCHVANLGEEIGKKSGSASRRRRYTDIVRKALSYLKLESSPPFMSKDISPYAIESCERVLKEIEDAKR